MPAIEKLGDGYDALITKFNAGQIAMCRVALWNSTYLQDDVNWKAMNAPRANDGTQAEVLFLNGIGISSSCENPEAAEKFIKTSEKQWLCQRKTNHCFLFFMLSILCSLFFLVLFL